MPVVKNDLKLYVNHQFIAPSLYNQITWLIFITDIFRPRIKCTTLFGGALCLCEVSRFLSNFLTSCSSFQVIRLGAGDDFPGPSGHALPLLSRVSLSHAHSFLHPLLPSTCYTGYNSQRLVQEKNVKLLTIAS